MSIYSYSSMLGSLEWNLLVQVRYGTYTRIYIKFLPFAEAQLKTIGYVQRLRIVEHPIDISGSCELNEQSLSSARRASEPNIQVSMVLCLDETKLLVPPIE